MPETAPNATATNAATAPISAPADLNPAGKTAQKADAPAKGGKAAVPPPPEKRAYKIKVLDKEEDIQVTDDEIKTYIQKARAADRKFEEAASMRKDAQTRSAEVEGVLKLLNEGTDDEVEAALAKMGRNTRAFAEKLLARELQKELMDPKERELMEAKAERDRLRAAVEEREKTEKAAAEEKAMKERTAKLKDAIAVKINAVLKDSELPATDRTVSKIAYYMQQATKLDIPMDLDQIRNQVLSDYKADFGHIFKASTPEQIVAMIGEEKLKELRKWDNERITGKKSTPKETPLGNARNLMKKKFKTPDQDNLERFGTLYPNLSLED